MTRHDAGIALLLTSSLLSFLLVVSAGFLYGCRLVRLMSAESNARRAAARVAESGTEYAAARLSREESRCIDPKTTSNRGDDWETRDPHAPDDVRSLRTLNPSFCHGESWTDDASLATDGLDNDGDTLLDEPGEASGAFTPGEAPGQDLTGDGRFSAWSGRLRGFDGPFDGLFSLQIASARARIPINGGRLDPPHHNRDTYDVHLGLVRLTNNLAALLNVRRSDLQGGSGSVQGEPVRVSRVGDALMRNRPPGGYRSTDQIRQVLLQHGCGQAECDRLIPYLDWETPSSTGAFARPGYGSAPGTTTTIEISSAPFELLQAAWMYLRMYAPSSDPLQSPMAGLFPDPADNPFSNTPYGVPDMRAGGLVSMQETLAPMIYPDEAEALARRTVQFRAGPDRHSWLAFRQDLTGFSRDLFDYDCTLLEGRGFEDAALLWARMKADLAFTAVCPELPGIDAPTNGLTWGIPHPFAAFKLYACFLPPRFRNRHVKYPNPAPPTLVPYTDSSADLWMPPMTLAPPTSFSVMSQGMLRSRNPATTMVKGRLQALQCLLFTCQADFENFTGTPASPWPGITPVAGQERPVRPAFADLRDPGRSYPWAVTAPAWHFAPDCSTRPAIDRYPSQEGALGLAGIAVGPESASHYWPFTEDPAVFPEREPCSETPSGAPTSSFYTPAPYTSGPWSLNSSAGLALPLSPSTPPGFVGAMTLEGWFVEPLSPVPTVIAEISPVAWDDWGVYCDDPPPDGPDPELYIPKISIQTRLLPSGEWEVNFLLAWRVHHSAAGIEDWMGPFPVIQPPVRIPADAGTSGHHHIALTVEALPDYHTRFRLLVDGQFSPASESIRTWWMAFPPAPRGSFLASSLDEIRLYDRAVDPGEIQTRHRFGRFVVPEPGGRTPTYRSPLHLPDRPIGFLQAHWLGLPSGLVPERVGIETRLHAYSDEAGLVPLPASPVQITGDETVDISVLQGARSFRYEVTFVNLTPGGVSPATPLYHTPLFESAWFTVRNPGRAPAWSVWVPR